MKRVTVLRAAVRTKSGMRLGGLSSLPVVCVVSLTHVNQGHPEGSSHTGVPEEAGSSLNQVSGFAAIWPRHLGPDV